MGIIHTNIHINHHNAQHFTLTNVNGVEVELTNFGATLIDIRTPDKNGRIESITLAHRDMNGYAENAPYFGCIIGRVAGRIAHGEFQLNGQKYTMPKNQGEHHLHGGKGAMSHQLWAVQPVEQGNASQSVCFQYTSPDGENGYSGKLEVSVQYTLSDDNTLSIDYQAHTDAPTLCNLTNHAYFNLSGNVSRTVHQHTLSIAAHKVCAMDEHLLVTGDEWPVQATDFDFQTSRPLAQALNSDDERLILAKGLDHYFILDKIDLDQPHVILYDAESGRRLQVFTDQPCAVLYAHNYAGNEALRYGATGQAHDALCIETQKLPHVRGVNGDHAAALYPNQVYQQHTIFRFDVV